MMRLWYRFINARFVQRLYSQQDFEMMFGSEVMRSGRAKRTVTRPHRESPSAFSPAGSTLSQRRPE